MKFTTAYYLLLLYALLMLKPLIEITADALSHTFAEAYHIQTVHAKYGNNHVELALADTAADNDTKNNSTKTAEQITVHISVEENNTIANLVTTLTNYGNNEPAKLPIVPIGMQIPPPKYT